MKKSLLIQFVHNCVYTACFVQVFHVCRACRCKVAEVWSLCTDLICKADIKVHSDLMSDSRKVKHTVCGASKCHVYCQGIEDCFFCHDVSWTDVLSVHFHNLHTCMFCKTDTLGIYSRNGSVSFQSHTKNLCETVHGVCCVHTGTGSACRTCFHFTFCQAVLIKLACCVSTYCLEHTGKACLVSVQMSGKHWAAAYKYSRNIQSGCCHQKSGYVLVTVWNHYQCIKLMCHCHGFCGICDQVSGNQRIFHSNVSHCNTVTYCDCREHNRCTACHCHTKLNCLCDLVQVHMTRYDFIIRTYDTYQRSVHFFFCHSKSIKQGTVRCLLCACFYCITSHCFISSFLTVLFIF